MKKSILCTFALFVLSACGAAPGSGESSDEQGLAQTSAAFTEAASATLTVTTDTTTKYCATVNVKNNGSVTTNSWTAVVNLNNTKKIAGQNGTNGTFVWTASQITITPNAYNTNIAPNGTASPAPSFCVSRTSKTQVPRAASATANYCKTYYYDNDGDGYGNSNSATTICTSTVPPLYVATGGDCCDSDVNAHPGQTNYFTTANGCSSFDYNCDGQASPQSNGATDCYNQPMNCSVINNECVADTSVLPADCNGSWIDRNTAACGASWSFSARGCTNGSSAGGIQCARWMNGGPAGTQACR